jgi:hypothetical protein
MENMQTLSELSIKFPLIDKGSIKADGTPGHNYTEAYEKYLGSSRQNPVNILEIGFGGGDSLKLWLEYFDDATIFCFDNNLSRIEEYGYTHDDRIKIIYADQLSADSILNAVSQSGREKFDFIIDDGSHIENHINTTFTALFDKLNSGSYYFVEDAPYNMTFSHSDIENIEYSGELIIIKKRNQ